MPSPIPGGSVYNQHRLAPSGPIVSGVRSMINIGFDQVIDTSVEPVGVPLLQWDGVTPESLVTCELPRDCNFPLAPTNRCEVKLKRVGKNSLIAVWANFSLITDQAPPSLALLSGAIAAEVLGVKAIIPWAVMINIQTQVLGHLDGLFPFSLHTLFPNPAGVEADVIVYPVAGWAGDSIVPLGFVAPTRAQTSIMAAEIQ